jgi:hypothetical protein
MIEILGKMCSSWIPSGDDPLGRGGPEMENHARVADQHQEKSEQVTTVMARSRFPARTAKAGPASHHQHRDTAERKGVGNREYFRPVEVTQQKLAFPEQPEVASDERHP